MTSERFLSSGATAESRNPIETWDPQTSANQGSERKLPCPLCPLPTLVASAVPNSPSSPYLGPCLIPLLLPKSKCQPCSVLEGGCVCVCSQSCLTLCDLVDCSPPGSPVHGNLPGKNTGAVVWPFPTPWDLESPALAGRFFTTSTTWEALEGEC